MVKFNRYYRLVGGPLLPEGMWLTQLIRRILYYQRVWVLGGGLTMGDLYTLVASRCRHSMMRYARVLPYIVATRRWAQCGSENVMFKAALCSVVRAITESSWAITVEPRLCAVLFHKDAANDDPWRLDRKLLLVIPQSWP